MKRICALLLALVLVAAAVPDVHAAYSKTANSGIRGQTCVSLDGTGAASYYTGSYRIESLSTLDSVTLLATLRERLTETHTCQTTFAQCRELAAYTDCVGGDGTTVSLLFTGYAAAATDNSSENLHGWTRTAIWPQELGGFTTGGPGADLHHIRPTDQYINVMRSDLKYGNVTDGTALIAEIDGCSTGGSCDGTYFEPADAVKGDVARIILYMYVRYGGDSRYSCDSIGNVFESVDVLLQWCALDPVDTWEMGRNEVVAGIQGNRNVFIDYPELAWLLFDREVPTDMTTPSGKAAEAVFSVCGHEVTELRNAVTATCTTEGYTGDTCCVACGQVLACGERVPASGHTNADGDQNCDSCGAEVACGHGKTQVIGVRTASCTQAGYSGDVYCAYCGQLLSAGSTLAMTEHTPVTTGAVSAGCLTDGYSGDAVCAVCGKLLAQGKTVAAPGTHTYGDWETVDGQRQRSCTVCGETQLESVTETTASGPADTEAAPTSREETSATETTAATEDAGPVPSDARLMLWLILAAVVIAGTLTWIGARDHRRGKR